MPHRLRDLYQFLGVPRDADQDTIHLAYRNLAKRMHPDVGGDPATFEQLRVAHELLMDDERRAHYDRTGEVLPADADNGLAHILTMVSGAFDEAVHGVLQAGDDLTKVDLLQRMRKALVCRDTAIEKNRIEALSVASRLETMLGRFVSDDVAGPNHLETIVREKIRQAGEIVKNIAAEREKIATVLKFLGHYRYRSDPAALVFTEPPPYRPKVTVDFEKSQQEPASFEEQLAEKLYGYQRRG
jgi:curved DNA-binding protein CbpA